MTKNWISSLAGQEMRIQKKKQKCFRDVLYTTLDVEVAGWIRSLQLRALNYRMISKTKFFLIIGERRNVEVKKSR